VSVAIVLGLLQGFTEWLPVSSEGIVATAYSLMTGDSLANAVSYALWLHAGTAVASIVIFRREVVGLAKDLGCIRMGFTPFLRFLVVTTIVSAVVAIPLLLGLQELSNIGGALAMGVVGVLMLINGGFLLRRQMGGIRGREEMGLIDGVLAGLAQGIAVIPGLSRSGLTITSLLGRGMQRKEAVVVSFIMSIPASIGAAFFSVINNGFTFSIEHVVGLIITILAGLLTLRVLLLVVGKLNIGAFVVFVGLIMTGGALFEIFR